MKIFKVRIRREQFMGVEAKGKHTSIEKFDKMFSLAVEKGYWVLDDDLYDYQGQGGTKYTNDGNIMSGKVGIARFDTFVRVRKIENGYSK